MTSYADDDGMVILRARLSRDGHCTFPGCESRRCDAHHVVHWAEGGPTAIDNLVLLCQRHHTLVHDGCIGVEGSDAAEPIFRRPDERGIVFGGHERCIDWIHGQAQQ